MKRVIVVLISILIILSAWTATYVYANAPTDESETARYVALAERQSAVGGYGSAIRLYQRAIAIEDSTLLRIKLAECWRSYGNRVQFHNELKDLIRTYPEQSQAYELLAEDYYNSSEFSKCCNVVDSAWTAGIQTEILDELYLNSAFRYKILPKEYESAGVLIGGYAVVESGEKTYIVDSNLNPICADGFDCADVFYGNSAAVTKAGSQYFIDKNGEKYMVPEGDFTKLYSYSEGRAVFERDGKYGYIDIFGGQVLWGYEAASTFSSGYAAVCDEQGWYLIDPEGDAFTNDRYEDIELDENNTAGSGGFCFVRENGYYHIFDVDTGKTGRAKFEDVRAPADENLAAVKRGDLWGFADRSGNMRIVPAFDDAAAFCRGVAAVKRGDLWGYIDSQGRIIIDFVFEGAKQFSDEGMAPVQIDGKWRYLKLDYRESLK